jgi:hypothetical protein
MVTLLQKNEGDAKKKRTVREKPEMTEREANKSLWFVEKERVTTGGVGRNE